MMIGAMPIDSIQLLAALRAFAGKGGNAGALDLHLEALLASAKGDLSTASESFTAAQNWESAQGYRDGALHTSHQMALTVNFGGDLDKLNRYYHETTITLGKMRNRKGAALCLRSVGEIAIAIEDGRELAKAWDLSERLFAMLRLPEASQLAIWRNCLRECGIPR